MSTGYHDCHYDCDDDVTTTTTTTTIIIIEEEKESYVIMTVKLKDSATASPICMPIRPYLPNHPRKNLARKKAAGASYPC